MHQPVLPILFASPEFTPWTDPSGTLLFQWAAPLFDHIYTGIAPDSVDIVVAVVDEIPGAKRVSQASSTTEGLSLLLADPSCVTASIAAPARMKSGASEESAFFLAVESHTHTLSHEIGLRLAQTIFRNGRDRTLLGMRWSRKDPSAQYILDACHDLATCYVTSPFQEIRSSVNVPLQPVTQRRKVVSSMGNILRQVSRLTTDDRNHTESVPASMELEQKLPKYVRERGMEHEKVAVWALVEPSTSASTASSLQCEAHSLESVSHIQKSISQGSKLHRVVSGGGGWGKKQGLLSLDPETTFQKDHSSRRTSLRGLLASSTEFQSPLETGLPYLAEELDLEGSIASLSQAASPGDYIQFFVASESNEAANHPTSILEEIPRSGLTYSFGVSSGTTAGSPSDTQQKLILIPDHFGAISESAITYSQNKTPDSLSTSPRCETKLSVPGAEVQLITT